MHEENLKSKKELKETQGPIELSQMSLFQYFISALPVCFTSIMLSAIDYLSVASVYYPSDFLEFEETKKITQTEEIVKFNYQSVSRLLFVMSAVLAMVINNVVTKVSWGAFAGSIIENMKFTKQIVVVIVQLVVANQQYAEMNKLMVGGVNGNVAIVILNSVICFMLGTLLFSALSFMFYFSGLSKLLEFVPTPIISGFMGGIAWVQFKTFLENVQLKEDSNNPDITNILGFIGKTNIHYKMAIYGIIIGFTIYMLSRMFPKFSLTIVLSVLSTTVITYVIAFIKSGSNCVQTLRYLQYVKGKDEDTFFNLFKFLKILGHVKYIDLKLIWACKFSILNIGIFSMLHYPINYSVYRGFISSYVNDEATLKKHASTLNYEMKTQAVVNLIGAFTSFIPSYILGSYSVAYFRSGGRSKVFGIMAGLCNATLPLLGPKIYEYLPVFIVGSIPFYICCCFFYDFIIDIWNKMKSVIFPQPANEIAKPTTSHIDYEKLTSKNFVPYSNLPAHLRHCDIFDFIISLLVISLFIFLDEYTIVSLMVGFILSFLKQYFYTYQSKKVQGKQFVLSRDFGCNFIKTVVYKGAKYNVFKPVAINFWNYRTFDESKHPLILDMRDIKYIDILAANKIGDDTLIIY
ncbi:hypothetical protein CDIK_0205 [Cucumispora dikerogammari]|nr:hypothetical protein CDIK_0205 [Cucumispora dikerogammari]